MKKYITPDMKAMAFTATETIAVADDSAYINIAFDWNDGPANNG